MNVDSPQKPLDGRSDATPMVAESDSFRTPGALERLGARLRHVIPSGRLRDCLRSAYRAALAHGPAAGLRCYLPDGEVVQLLPAYRHVTWNLREYHAFKAVSRPDAVVLDVGANVGCYSILFGHWVGPRGRVYAFEPYPDAFRGLETHTALNGLGGIVHPVPAAVSSRSGAIKFLTSGMGTGRPASEQYDQADATMIQVPGVSIDDFCGARALVPDIIKIDVEGHELDVLRGATETLRRAGDRVAVFVEMHPTVWRSLGLTPAAVDDEIRRLGFRAVPLREGIVTGGIEGECLRLVRC